MDIIQKNQTPITYELEITINIPNYDAFSSYDINTFYSYRVPFAKTATIHKITLTFPLELQLIVQQLLTKNIYPDATLQIYLVDTLTQEADNLDFRRFLKTNLVTKKNFKIVESSLKEHPDAKNSSPIITFTLVNPVLHYLSINNSLNKILIDKSAKDALLYFEEQLITGFSNSPSDGQFSFRRIIQDDQFNDYQYENILLNCSSDLTIPKYLIENYKMTHSFSYYFFDDFEISSDNSSSIKCSMVNLNDISLFEQFDVYSKQGGDLQQHNRIKAGPMPLVDTGWDSSYLTEPSVFIKKPSGLWTQYKTIGETQVPTEIADATQVVLNQHTPNSVGEPVTRGFNAISNSISSISRPSTGKHTIYTPDGALNALKRYVIAKNQTINSMESLVEFEIDETHIDAIQFHRIYNLESGNETEFNFVPIGIINIFRKSSKVKTGMTHTVRYKCIKFADSTETISNSFKIYED